MRSRIPFASANLNVATTAVQAHAPMPVLLALGLTVLNVAWVLLWALAATGVALQKVGEQGVVGGQGGGQAVDGAWCWWVVGVQPAEQVVVLDTGVYKPSQCTTGQCARQAESPPHPSTCCARASLSHVPVVVSRRDVRVRRAARRGRHLRLVDGQRGTGLGVRPLPAATQVSDGSMKLQAHSPSPALPNWPPVYDSLQWGALVIKEVLFCSIAGAVGDWWFNGGERAALLVRGQ